MEHSLRNYNGKSEVFITCRISKPKLFKYALITCCQWKLRIVRLSLRDSMTNTYLNENQLQSCNAPYLPIHCTVTRCLGNDYGLNGLKGSV